MIASESEAADRLIGETVKELRGERSQKTLADEMRSRFGHAWSQSTVWSIETGARPLRLTEAQDLADLLGVSIERLLPTPVAELRELRKLSEEAPAAAVYLSHWTRETTDLRDQLRALLAGAEAHSEADERLLREARAALAAVEEMLDRVRKEPG